MKKQEILIFAADEDCLKTTIRVRTVPDHVPEIPDQGQLLSLIRTHPRITYDELAKRTGVNRKTIQRHIQALKRQGRLRRVGPARGGHWEISPP